MESNPKRMPNRGILAGTAFAALFCYFGGGLQPIWWSLWIGLGLAFVVASRIRRSARAGLTAGLIWLVASTNLFEYLNSVIGVPFVVLLSALLVPSLVFGLVLGLWHRQLRKGKVWFGVLIASTLWTSYEFCGALLSPHGTFGHLAYTQMDFLPIVQVASLGGSYSIGFFMLALAAGVGAAFWRYPNGRRSLAPLGCIFLLELAIVAWGWIRIQNGNVINSEQTVVVGAIASSDLRYDYPSQGNVGMSWLLQYEEAADRFLAKENIQLLVLPEKIVSLNENEAAIASKRFKDLAQVRNATIVLGWERRMDIGSVNEVVAFLPSGENRVYAKRHLLPGLEDDNIPGSSFVAFDAADMRLGLAICKDMDFLDTSESYGEMPVQMVVVPAWDFGADAWLHSRMAMLRGIEGGFGILRAARRGLLSVSDSRGRVIAERSADGSDFTSLHVGYSNAAVSTLYARLGDWFGWLCVVIASTALLVGLFKRSGNVTEY